MAGTLCLVLALAMASPLDPMRGDDPDNGGVPPDPGRIVFLLEYIGSDYASAVQNGRIVDPSEYRELTAFCREVVAAYSRIRNSDRASEDLQRLTRMIRDLAPPERVRALSHELSSRISDAFGASPVFASPVDLSRGRQLYLDSCAVCHGAEGGGDGEAAPGLDPVPTSFKDERMNLVRPREVYGAIWYGIDGTAMPYFSEAYTPEEVRDLSFHVMTLRGSFDPRAPSSEIPVSSKDLEDSSNVELLGLLRKTHPQAQPSAVDYVRLHPPAGRVMAASAPAASGQAPVVTTGIEAATRLEDAFGMVARSVFPSVVGLSFYGPPGDKPAKHRSGWRESTDDVPAYPGYRLLRTGTGFFVDEDGYILSCQHLLTDPRTREVAEIIDVEMSDNRHFRARVIGAEPTVDLLVLKVEDSNAWPALAIGGQPSVRVGQWAIALGDPPGVERTLAPGIIAALPERDCYQEKRTSTLLQTSLRLGRESFCGPVVDIHGDVIGVSVPRSPLVEDVEGAPDTAFALPIRLAATLYQALKAKESRKSPWLGISVLDLSSRLLKSMKSTPLTGVYIDDVFDPSPASKAGIRPRDVLMAMDGNRIFAVQDFQKWLYMSGIGKTVTLEVYRDGRVDRKRLTIEERPQGATPR